jgi:pilus assembly protein TadC
MPWRRPPQPAPQDLVEVVDRLQVAVGAGHSLHTAIVAVAGIGSGPTALALAQVADQVSRGRRLGEALGHLVDELGPAATPLVAVLSTSLQSGSAPGPALQRLADSERRRRRRRAEARVRRLPVLLLAPLVGLVLPSFVVVTIVPVAAATASAGLVPASP